MSIIANFSWTEKANDPCVITYTDTSSPTPGCWLWTFPGGTIISGGTVDEKGPHDVQYHTVGTHDATLWVGEKGTLCCPDEPCDCEFTVDFTTSRQIGDCTYDFTPTKTLVTGTLTNCKYSWDFGDGTTSTEESPSHSFSGCANFDVKLSVTCGCCKAQKTKNVVCDGCSQVSAKITKINIGSAGNCRVCFSPSIDGSCTVVDYVWRLDGILTTSQPEFCKTYDISEDGDQHIVELTITDSAGCMDTLSTVFTIDCDPLDCASCPATERPGAFPVAIVSGIPDGCGGQEFNKSHTLFSINGADFCGTDKQWRARPPGFNSEVKFQVQGTIGTKPLTNTLQISVVLRMFALGPTFQIFQATFILEPVTNCTGTFNLPEVNLPQFWGCDNPHNTPYPDVIFDVPNAL